MNALVILMFAVVIFAIAYFTYGSFVSKSYGLDNNVETPAHSMYDGVDYVPAKSPVLLGHHFASISGAAPIIGPIAAVAFGWLPALLWIIIGGIFIGGVHDSGSIFASIRHGGKSIGGIINENVGETGKKLFSIFAWLTLVLVVSVFAIVTANTFVSVPSAGTASILFIALAIVFGFTVYRNNFSMVISTIIGVALLFGCVWLGLAFPIELTFNTWIYILLVYIFISSVTPVWILLQPRDYLNSYLLYSLLLGAIVGIFIAHPTVNMPAFTSFSTDLGYLFPVLFVTIACGSISGFHSLVSSGTTSKQLDKESDARLVGYGGMLLECVLAVIALITAIILTQGSYAEALGNGGPVALFSAGIGGFLTKIGIPLAAGKSFASLVISAFALTTLDTATRLGRFIFSEYFEKSTVSNESKGITSNRYFATFVTVVAAGALALSGQWSAIWPIFGSANQLLAALALLAISVWLAKSGKNNNFTKYPMIFMFAVTLSALVQLIVKNFSGGSVLLGTVGTLLFILAIVLAVQAYKALQSASSGQNLSS
ncbi:MAG: carbon starvation protein A [Clostridiales bacterium]|nr:carbon starvation protein A [Clostridiales bacterium]MCF8021271.1 carbon starvation protein A [Clostridiales bacterium]